MFGFVAIDVLVGLVTIYLVSALACTAIVEAISSWMNLRSNNLEAALRELFAGDLATNQPFVDAFYAHPLVQSLSKGSNGRPSYIPPDVVGRVTQSLLLNNDPDGSLTKAIDKLPGLPASDAPSGSPQPASRVKDLFQTFISQGQRDLQSFRNAVETHFDAVMDRAAGWVKRRQQTVALIASTILVLCANVDTFAIATALYANPELRAGLISQAEQIIEDGSASEADRDASAPHAWVVPATVATPLLVATSNEPLAEEKQKLAEATAAYNQAKSTIENTGLRFGWKTVPSGREWIPKIFGLLISVFAIALGAPFWFDVLNRFMKVRQAGVSPAKTKKEKERMDGME